MKAIQHLRSVIPKEVFEDLDFNLIEEHLSHVARRSLMKRLLQKGDVIRVSRGLYVFGENWRKNSLSKFTIAGHLYSPSYVSFESSLSFHNLIPESVPTTTSACFQMKKKNFKTPYGDFTYSHIPEKAFRLGVTHQAQSAGAFLMASPLKALFDVIYFYRKNYTSLGDLEQDLRIDLDLLKSYADNEKYQDLETLALSYGKKNCQHFFQILIRETR